MSTGRKSPAEEEELRLSASPYLCAILFLPANPKTLSHGGANRQTALEFFSFPRPAAFTERTLLPRLM
jgi:hypothetical protein